MSCSLVLCYIFFIIANKIQQMVVENFCVLDRLWQSPKTFLAKRGEVFIDDLFRYLSALLGAGSTFFLDLLFFWVLIQIWWFSCRLISLWLPCDQKLLLEGTRKAKWQFPWEKKQRERWKNGSQQLWPIWPSQSILPSYLAINLTLI